MISAGEIALQLQDQGWRGLLPLLPHDATPHIRLTPDKAAEVASGRGKAPGRWVRAGWSLLPDWRTYPDDAETVEGWASWPGVNVGLRACYVVPWVVFIDVDVTHHGASAELMAMFHRRLQGREFIWRIGNAPKFLIPVQVTEPIARSRSTVVEIDGERHMVELLGQGQQAVVAGIHPKTGRPYFWPEGGLEETEPTKLPLVTPAELHEILGACSKILLRHGPAVGRKGRTVQTEFSAEPKPLSELRAYHPALARAAAEFVVNSDWAYDDWVAWAYALRGAFGTDGKAIWLRFSVQSTKHDHAAAEKVWRDVTQAERGGHLRAGAGTVIAIAQQEGFTPPPAPGLLPYFDGGDQSAEGARSDLEQAVTQWVGEALAYTGKGDAPRDAIAGGVGLGKTTVTLQALAALARGKTVHFYAPTLALGAEVVAKARAIGLDAVLIRGREKNKRDPDRWPALCLKDDVAATLGRCGRNVWESLCRKEDDFGNVTKCEYFDACPYVGQFDNLEGKLVVLAHEYITLPKTLIAKPLMIVVDERFHSTLIRTTSLQTSRVTADRPTLPGLEGGLIADLLAHDARLALKTLAAGKTMASTGLSPERLKRMARTEEILAAPPAIWPDMPYAEQRSRAQQLQEVEAFKLAKLWRVLAQDHDRMTQRVVIASGIEWHGKLQDRVFIHSMHAPEIPATVPVLLLDANHDPLIGAVTLPTNRRTAILPSFNAEVIQVRDTAGSKNKLLGREGDQKGLDAAARRRQQIITLARHEAAQGRRVLIGTYKPVADLLCVELGQAPGIEVVHFGSIRGLDGWKDFDTVIVAGREQPPPQAIENIARCLFGADPERLLLTGNYVPQMRGHLMKDGSRTAVMVQVHPDPRVQALVEQVREREIEQMVGRLRLVHRPKPARVFLLTNTPTALAVDRLTTWEGIMPDKMEQAAGRSRGVLPLSAAELARVHPDLWATGRDAENWQARKGTQFPIRYSYWNVSTLSAATLVSYRRLGQCRGSPHRAIIPGDVCCPVTAALDLEPLLGVVEDVRVVETLHRPASAATLPAVPSPEPDPTPGPAAWLLEKVPAGQRPYWSEQLRQDRAQSERRLLRHAASLHVIDDDTKPLPLIFPHLYPAEQIQIPEMIFRCADRILLSISMHVAPPQPALVA